MARKEESKTTKGSSKTSINDKDAGNSKKQSAKPSKSVAASGKAQGKLVETGKAEKVDKKSEKKGGRSSR